MMKFSDCMALGAEMIGECKHYYETHQGDNCGCAVSAAAIVAGWEPHTLGSTCPDDYLDAHMPRWREADRAFGRTLAERDPDKEDNISFAHYNEKMTRSEIIERLRGLGY